MAGESPKGTRVTALVGPAGAITRVPVDGCPAMRLSLRAVTGARVAQRRRSGAYGEELTVRLFLAEGKGGRFGSRRVRSKTGADC